MKYSHSAEFSPIRTVNLADGFVEKGRQAGVVVQTACGPDYTGRHVSVDGLRCLNFGSCSYLGLERRAELRDGVEDASRRIGTQFPFPRLYLQSPLYAELEANLTKITGRCVLVSSNTTLGHISALPVLVQPDDAIVIDQFAHASLQLAVGLLRGIRLVHLRHSRMDQLRGLSEQLSQSHRAIWYVCDGLYSMHGDFAPIDSLANLLSEFPKLNLYIDDAHSTSWTGCFGRGHVLEKLAGHDRVTVALSLNKAFSAAGGAIAFPKPEPYWSVRRGGGPMIFSGPIQPPMLGAAVASSKLHLTDEFRTLQAAECERIRLVLQLAREHEVPLGSWDESPIFFVPCGPEGQTCQLARSLQQRGFYACAAGFPAVPRNRSGIRFTVSIHNEIEDIHAFMTELALQVRTVKSGDRR